MSRPSEPVGIVSISTAFWFLPRRMIEPLPKALSICDSAASSALVLSTEVPSTRRRLACVTAVFLLHGRRQIRNRGRRRHLCMICSYAQVLSLFFCIEFLCRTGGPRERAGAAKGVRQPKRNAAPKSAV